MNPTNNKPRTFPDAYALGFTFGWSSAQIELGDVGVYIKTRDVQHGDLAHVRVPGGDYVAILKIDSPTHIRLAWPNPQLDKTFRAEEVEFIGRCVAVLRGGKPVKTLYDLRPAENVEALESVFAKHGWAIE